MPATAIGSDLDTYDLAVRQFTQQILPSGLPQTTVWSFGSLSAPGTAASGGSFNYPAFTIEARRRVRVRIKWVNDLKDASGNYLPHLLPVDQTLHWANPPRDDAIVRRRSALTQAGIPVVLGPHAEAARLIR